MLQLLKLAIDSWCCIYCTVQRAWFRVETGCFHCRQSTWLYFDIRLCISLS